MASKFEGLGDYLDQQNQAAESARAEAAEAEEAAEREANKGILDRIKDSISGMIDGDAIRNAMGETYNNGYDMNPTTPRPFGAVQDIFGDVVDAANQMNENRLKFLNESANLQEKAMNGQVTEEDIDNLRQSGREASVSLANLAASPFRQAARNLMREADDNTSPWQGVAQSLEMTDVAQEYFMTPAENLQKKREIEQGLGLPEGTIDNNDIYREALEMYNFKQKSENIEEVWEKYPELQRITQDMSPEAAAIALHNMPEIRNSRGVIDTFMSFLEKGNTELEYNNLQYKIMMGRATDEEIKRAEDLKSRVEQYNKMEAPGFFQSPLASMAAGVAGSLPEMGQSLVEGAEGGGAAGAALTVGAVALTIATGGTDLLAAGGIAATRAAIMRALSSEAGRKLLKTGIYSGLIHGMGAPESGRNYSEMKDMKKPDGTQLYTDEEARNWSLLRGYTNAAIEAANFGMAAKAVYPVANRVFAQSVEQITRETLGRETLKDFARDRVEDWLKLTATESAEEAAQSAADDVISNVALSTKGEDAAQYKQYSIMDIATRAGQAFIESLPASMGFATIGAGVGTITGAGRMARARKRAADMERNYGKQQTQTYMGVMAVEQLQKAVEQGNLEKVAPDVQKKVLKEQLAGTEFSRAYIDVEMAMQKENGREDLQKVAEAAGMSADELEAAITVNGYIPVGTETLAQAKVSPDLLDSVSFSEDADSMARMRENGKTIIEDYKKNFDKMMKRQEKLADAIIENNMENASAEQKEILRQVMFSNISNPAQAWNDLWKICNDELQEKIAPALEALKRGMGNTGLMEIEDEQGNKKTVRYTENDEWYRNFYKTFKRRPTTAELEDMAIAMVTGDSNAPKVAGWIPDSAEAQAEFEKNRPVIEQLKHNLDLLDSVKEEAKKLTGVEMELTQGLTPEAFKVYRAISSWTNKAGGKISRAGRISAILVARHADLYAEAIRKKTGKNYTAEDYIREKLGFQLVQAGIDRDGVLKQMAGGNAVNEIPGDILLQRAWHGTPHDFEKFDLGSQDGQGWIDINPGPDGRRIVHILETADESTFMHEMAHAFLFDLEDLARIDDTSAKEMEIVNQWTEWKKGDYKEYKRTAWADEFAQREQAIIDAEENHDYERAEKLKAEWRQERFARGFEMYLKEGNAPAPGLKAVFRLFKQFLSAIYKAFTGDGGKPSVQVRRVMDRMIASEDEIEAAALQDRYSDVVKAGGEKLFNEREEDTMKRWAKEEREAAKEKVLKLVMRDLEREKQLEYNNRMTEERERYQKELSQENIFLARNLIAETKNKESATMWFDSVEEFEALDKVTPDMETLVNQHMQEYGQQLDKILMDSHLSQEAIDKAMDSSKYRVKLEKYILKGMERKKNLVNSINAKARAAMTSIEEKLNALPEDVDLQLEKKDNPIIKDIVKEITKLRFAGKWSTLDINHIESMLRASTQEEVRKALNEFKDRQKQQKQNMQDIEEATKGMESFYRDLIKQTTEKRPMSETCNIKYYKDKERNTERRVQQMMKAKNWEMAIHQQRQKVFYSMMVRQARENRETRDKMIKELRRKLTVRTVKIPKDERYWFNRILYIMKINPTNPKMPEGGVTSLDNIFKEQQEALENIYVPDQLIQIRDAGENFGDYNKMTLNDFREAYEDLVRLYELGRDKFNFKSIGGKSFEDVAQEIISDPDKMPGLMALTRKVGPNQGGIGYIDTLGNLGQTGHDVAKYIQQYHNSILKPENILEMLGPKAHKYIYGLLEKAAEKESELAEKNLRAIQDINAMFTREEHQKWTEQKYDFPGTKGWKITKENILMMAINYGSEKNRQRLIGGLIEDGRKKDKMSAQQVQQAVEELFKETMTAKDWEFVQRLWDHIGSYWHDIAAVEEKLNGIALGKVEPLPFSIQTADGKIVNLKGGYMHIKYDFEKSSRAEEQEINDMAMSISAGARRLGVGRGMTKSRTENNVYRELDLKFDVINQHLQDVIHNIAYRIPIRDIYRLLHYKNYSTGVDMETYIREGLGVEAFRVLDAWAMDAWRQVSDNRNSAEGSLNKLARYLRTNATMAIMGFRIKPVIENLGNLPIAMNQIGSMKMLNALFGFYGNRGENYQEVIARSAFMRTRAENIDRDLKSQPGVFRQGNKLLETAKEHAYDMLVITDLMVSAPMWWQVYHDSIMPKMKEVQKENAENMQKRIDLAAKADGIKAEIEGHYKGAADIDEHLKTRRYGTPAEIEALRETEFAGISEGELRAQWGQHQNEIRNLRKELFKVEQEQEKENQLPVWSDDEIIEEAKQRAVFAADKVVRDTIGSGRVIDQSAVQRSTNEFVRLFTAFYSFFNAQWNLIYMAYAKSKYAPEGTGSIEKWAPLAKTLMFNVFLSALITTAVGFAFGLKGDSDDEKFETVTNAEGKKEKVEKPWLERFLRAYAKESLSISTGGLYGIRDIVQLMGDYAFSGQNFGYKMGSVVTRGISETLRAGDMLMRKGEKDAEIQEREEKRLKTNEEKLKKLKGKKRREYLQKWEEEQKYRKPPKRITYEEILSHGVTGLTTLTAARTGLTTTLTDAITHTMMYMMDKDMRYDPSWKNIVWSAIFDKKPVEREIPKKPPKEEMKTKKKKRKQSEQ